VFSSSRVASRLARRFGSPRHNSRSAPAAPQIAIDPDDIAGVVTSSRGAEAGAWVIAETSDTPTRLRKIVVTDDQGRYLIPDLPVKASFNVWVRGYGLVDSAPVRSMPGRSLALTVRPAPDARTAARVYPASYWYSLIDIPAEKEFPGTGPSGNGIAPEMQTQHHWINQIKRIATSATRWAIWPHGRSRSRLERLHRPWRRGTLAYRPGRTVKA
jgi:hypothetical protein